MRQLIRSLTYATCVAFLIAQAADAQTRGAPARYTASAVNMNTGAAGTIEIIVNRWSTDKERDSLMSTMMNKGAEKLLDALQDMPRVGYLRTPGDIGWDIHFARKVPGADGGERVILVTDRRISFWEAQARPRSIDYPFTVVEMRLNKDGEGEGKISVATRIIADKENNIMTLENYDMQPVMLTQVHRERASH